MIIHEPKTKTADPDQQDEANDSTVTPTPEITNDNPKNIEDASDEDELHSERPTRKIWFLPYLCRHGPPANHRATVPRECVNNLIQNLSAPYPTSRTRR